MVHRLAVTMVMALTLLSLTACAQAATAPEPVQTASEQSMSALDYFKNKATWNCESGKEHWRSSGTPVRGGVFSKDNAAPSASNSHLDTTIAGGAHNALQVYEHLVETRACYYEDSVMVPGLAKSWQVSADGLTWTIKTEDKAKWQNIAPVNGRAFTSADVAWMIDFQTKQGQLKSTWAPIKHAEPDANSIVLTLPAPDPDFLGNVLGERLNVMMPREIFEKNGDFKSQAIGTGPFMVKEFIPQQSLVLGRVDWRVMGADGKPLPYIDEVRFPFLADYAAEIAAFRTEQLDLNQTLGYLKRDYDTLMKANPKFKGYQDIAPIPRGLWMNHKTKPFDDINVRKALFFATNADDVVELAFQGGGVRSGFLPTAIAQYAWPVDKVQEQFKVDTAKAKDFLAKAGYNASNPLTFTAKVGNIPQDAGGEVVQQQLKLLGVDMKIDVYQGAAATAISSRQYDAAWSGVSPASIFPDRWMGGFLRCGDSRNYTNICDDEVDRLSTAQSKELDPAKRKVILDQLQTRLYDLAAWVPQMSLVYYRLYSCRVKNMPSTDYQQSLTGIAGAWLDQTGC